MNMSLFRTFHLFALPDSSFKSIITQRTTLSVFVFIIVVLVAADVVVAYMRVAIV